MSQRQSTDTQRTSGYTRVWCRYGCHASRDLFPRYRQSDPVRELLSFRIVRNTHNPSLGRPRVPSPQVYELGRCRWPIYAAVDRGIDDHRHSIVRLNLLENSTGYAASYIHQIGGNLVACVVDYSARSMRLWFYAWYGRMT